MRRSTRSRATSPAPIITPSHAISTRRADSFRRRSYAAAGSNAARTPAGAGDCDVRLGVNGLPQPACDGSSPGSRARAVRGSWSEWIRDPHREWRQTRQRFTRRDFFLDTNFAIVLSDRLICLAGHPYGPATLVLGATLGCRSEKRRHGNRKYTRLSLAGRGLARALPRQRVGQGLLFDQRHGPRRRPTRHVVRSPARAERDRSLRRLSKAQGRDLTTPVVVRFSDILAHRLKHLHARSRRRSRRTTTRTATQPCTRSR